MLLLLLLLLLFTNVNTTLLNVFTFKIMWVIYWIEPHLAQVGYCHIMPLGCQGGDGGILKGSVK